MIQVLNPYRVGGQDVEALIKSEKKLNITGGASVTQNFYSVAGIKARRDPYSIFASGNVTFSFMQWSMPLTFSYSNQNFSYQYNNPFSFNRFSIQPSYKWIKVHAGYNNMSFSPYTMSGHTFKGAGVELTPPGKWKAAALYGQFREATPHLNVERESQTPSFRRTGYGIKVGYDFSHERQVIHEPQYESQYNADGELKENFVLPQIRTSTRNVQGNVEFILFGAKDDRSSIPVVPDSFKIFPQDNLSTSLKLNTRILKTFSVSAEYAGSVLTRNTMLDESASDHSPVNRIYGNFMSINNSSAYYKAFKGNFSNDFKLFSLGATYEYVDPDYTTLGAYYFNNDLENITANLATRLLKQKMNLSINVGTQRNNLRDNKMSATRRLSLSSSVSYAVSERLTLSGTYSDFQTVTRVRSVFERINRLTPYDNIDTLNFSQVAKNYNGNFTYMFPKKNGTTQTLTGMLSVQQTDDQQGENSEGLNTSEFYNSNLSYTLGFQNLSLTTALNYNFSNMPGMETKTWGPTLVITKPILKLKNSISASYNKTSNNGIMSNEVFNVRLNSMYVFLEKHNLNASIVFLRRRSAAAERSQPPFRETTVGVIYSYSF
ncbi:hypothetical protein [Chryseosolibacter indicus]|uniref:TonB-dependent receptor n=1 Tax=Chryseosolibacter indicus TaxID=2782351 RepID=A0ABS5VT71_9BACT|nr:hypothetical protein [Chryseosolibacter indicus]MBT1704637.1 hypothetical protein [Chryseosolibacter indicus]